MNRPLTKFQANAIGVKQAERHFLFELHPKFAAFPTFPINLAFKQTSQDVIDFIASMSSTNVPGVPPFDAQKSVDGERGIEILKPLPVSSDGLDLEVRNKVIGVYDKGQSFSDWCSVRFICELTISRRGHDPRR